MVSVNFDGLVDNIKDAATTAPWNWGDNPGAQAPISAAAQLPQPAQPTGGGVAVPDPNGAQAQLLLRNQRLMDAFGLSEGDMRREVSDGGVHRNFGETLARLQAVNGPDLEDLQRKLYRAGFYGSTAKASDINFGRWDASTFKAAYAVLDESNRLAIAGDDRDWRQVLDDAANGESRSTGASTTTQSLVNLSTQGEARDSLRTAMKELLGRAPNSREVRRFHRRLNAAEQANPSTRTTTQGGLSDDPFADLPVDTEDVQDGGFAEGDADLMAEEEILQENGVESNAFQMGQLARAFESLMVGA